MKRIIPLLFLAFFISKAWSQELLNATEGQIKMHMKKQGAVLKSRKRVKFKGLNSKETMLFYTFPDEKREANDIMSVSFFMSESRKCHRYTYVYWSGKYLKQVIKEIHARNPYLKRNGDKLKWTNNLNTFDIEITKASDILKNPKYTSFTLIYSYRDQNTEDPVNGE